MDPQGPESRPRVFERIEPQVSVLQEQRFSIKRQVLYGSLDIRGYSRHLQPGTTAHNYPRCHGAGCRVNCIQGCLKGCTGDGSALGGHSSKLLMRLSREFIFELIQCLTCYRCIDSALPAGSLYGVAPVAYTLRPIKSRPLGFLAFGDGPGCRGLSF